MVRLEMKVEQLPAQHHNGAMAAVVAGVGELEGVGTRELELPVLVAPQAQAREGHRVIEELQVVALAGGAAGLQRALARAQAVQPEKNPCGDKDDRGAFPHAAILAASRGGLPPLAGWRRP